MATIQTIEDGYRNLVIKVDGTGAESATPIVDVSALNPPATSVRLLKVTYNLDPAASMQILWDATTDLVAWNLSGSNDCHVDFSCTAGIPNNAGAGVTGDVLITTAATTNYSLYLEFIKCGVGQ